MLDPTYQPRVGLPSLAQNTKWHLQHAEVLGGPERHVPRAQGIQHAPEAEQVAAGVQGIAAGLFRRP